MKMLNMANLLEDSMILLNLPVLIMAVDKGRSIKRPRGEIETRINTVNNLISIESDPIDFHDPIDFQKNRSALRHWA